MAETPWLELPYRSLSKENVRVEAARRGLTFRKLMGLYYQHDRERAVHLSLSWCVDRKHPEKLFGKARVDQFVGDLTKYLEGERVRLTVTGDADPHSLDELRGLKEERRGGDLQQQHPQQGPGPSNPRKRKRGGNQQGCPAEGAPAAHDTGRGAAPAGPFDPLRGQRWQRIPVHRRRGRAGACRQAAG